MLDVKDLAILFALMENPVASSKEIKENIENRSNTPSISIPTISRRIKRLEKDKIVLGAKANIRYDMLGLKMHNLIITPAENWGKYISILQLVFDEYPYTIFQNRIFGNKNGLLVQITLPDNTTAKNYLIELMNKLVEYGIISSFENYEIISPSLTYRLNLSKFNSTTQTWDIEPKNIREKIRQINNEMDIQELSSSYLESLDLFDLILIWLLVKDSRRSQREILRILNIATKEEKIDNNTPSYHEIVVIKPFAEDLPLSKQTISRRIQQIEEEELISGYSLLYEREQFGIFNQLFFIIKNDGFNLSKIDTIMKEIPFPGKIMISEKDILFWINLPIVEVMIVTNLMQISFNSVEIYFLDRKSLSYPPWFGNYDDKSNEWLDGHEYLVSDILSKIETMNKEKKSDLIKKFEERFGSVYKQR